MTTSPSRRVFVGIVTYQSGSVIRACIRSLLSQSLQPDGITVLDNDSDPSNRREIMRAGKGVSYVWNRINVGFGNAHNAIIASCRLRPEDYYLVLNPDTVLDRDFLSRIVAACADSGAGWATGKIYWGKTSSRRLYSVGHAMFRDGYAVNIGYGLEDEGQYDNQRWVFGAPGCSALLSGKLIHALQKRNGFVFDPTFFLFNEDVDLDWRANKLGYRCRYVPEAVVYHIGGESSPQKEIHSLANRFIMVIKNATTKDLVAYNILLMFAHVALRMVFDPVSGVRIATLVIRRLSHALKQRRATGVGEKDAEEWFRNASLETTGSPTTIRGRIRSHIRMRGLYRNMNSKRSCVGS